MGLFSFTPAWMKDDPKSEKKALEALAKLDSQSELAKIALEAPRHQVRLAAVKKLTDQDALAHIVVSHPAEAMEAMKKLTDGKALQYVIDNHRYAQNRIEAAAKLPDHALGQRIIAQVALDEKEEAVRVNAVKLLDDQTLLTEVIKRKDSSHQMLMYALSKITDECQFERIARETPHDTAREWALNRITDTAVREEISRWYLADPEAGAGYSAMVTALKYTDDQSTLNRLIRRERVNKELKIKALQKVTDVGFLQEILQSEDECFKWNETLTMPGTSESFKSEFDLKPYAEKQLRALEDKA